MIGKAIAFAGGMAAGVVASILYQRYQARKTAPTTPSGQAVGYFGQYPAFGGGGYYVWNPRTGRPVLAGAAPAGQAVAWLGLADPYNPSAFYRPGTASAAGAASYIHRQPWADIASRRLLAPVSMRPSVSTPVSTRVHV